MAHLCNRAAEAQNLRVIGNFAPSKIGKVKTTNNGKFQPSVQTNFKQQKKRS
jgi:hypothetical protein